MAESERLVELMNKSWEERLQETDQLYKEHQKDLAQIGICVAETGIKMEKDCFYLVNLNADPSLNELLVYYINVGFVFIINIKIFSKKRLLEARNRIMKIIHLKLIFYFKALAYILDMLFWRLLMMTLD